VSAWTGIGTNSVLAQARPNDRSRLKIVKVKPYIMQVHRGPDGKLQGNYYLFCRVETAEGLAGWGEGTNFPKVATIATEIEMMKPYVVGQSAWDIEKIWHMLYRGRNAMHGSAVQSAISGIDIALWDIVGQKLNVPLYQLLGGKIHERIRIYTSYRWGQIPRTADAYKKRSQELVSEGAIAGKWDPFFDEPYTPGIRPDEQLDFSRQAALKTIREVAEMVRGIREGGPEFEICVEAHAKFNTGSAVRIAKAIEPYNPMFFEEPVPPETSMRCSRSSGRRRSRSRRARGSKAACRPGNTSSGRLCAFTSPTWPGSAASPTFARSRRWPKTTSSPSRRTTPTGRSAWRRTSICPLPCPTF